MIIVNLFGVPGAGKSTGAAYIFSQLKMAGVNCELVTEFAKDKVWKKPQRCSRIKHTSLGSRVSRLAGVLTRWM